MRRNAQLIDCLLPICFSGGTATEFPEVYVAEVYVSVEAFFVV